MPVHKARHRQPGFTAVDYKGAFKLVLSTVVEVFAQVFFGCDSLTSHYKDRRLARRRVYLAFSAALFLAYECCRFPGAMRWADMVDSDVESLLDFRAPDTPAAVAPPRRAFPFGVVLRAYLCGLVDARVSRAALVALQRLLRADPRTAPVLHGSLFFDLVFGIELAAEAKMRHACAFWMASKWRLLSPDALQLWYYLLEVECCIDFPCVTLWVLLFPCRSPPPPRPA